jgi:hypothetical protein
MTTQPDPDPTTSDQAMLLTWLATHDAPCPACKYNLRNLTVPRCPECGRPLSLSVAVVEPYLRSWLAAVVLLFINAGPSVFVWIGLTRTLLERQSLDWPDQWWLRFLIIFYIAAAPLAVASLFLRRPFVRLGRSTQLYIVLTIAGITLAAFTTILWEMIR